MLSYRYFSGNSTSASILPAVFNRKRDGSVHRLAQHLRRLAIKASPTPESSAIDDGSGTAAALCRRRSDVKSDQYEVNVSYGLSVAGFRKISSVTYKNPAPLQELASDGENHRKRNPCQ
jgi:hypothetical protein